MGAAAALAACGAPEETDSAAPSSTATPATTGPADTAGDESTTTSPTSAGVTSMVPTSGTTDSDPTNPSDPTVDPSDSSSDCPGCINAGGVCESGEFDTACGRGGIACEACEAPAQCAEGVCEAPPGCSPDNCDGCCDGDDCIAVPNDAACGADGGECTSCEDPAVCDEGICQLPCEQSCIGCCTASGDCIEDADQTPDACGFLGFECTECDPGEECDFGLCLSPGCIDTCDGCCVGETCFTGFEDETCGFMESCDMCSNGTSCNGVDCAPQAGVQWQVTLVDGEVVGMQPGGGTWDAFGGNPDPYLQIEALNFTSSVVDNTTFPTWNETVTSSALTADLTAPLEFRMRDSDALLDQTIGTCTVNLPDTAFFGFHEVECEVDGNFSWSVLLSFAPVEK